MSLLEQDMTKKGRVDNKVLSKREKNLEFEAGGDKKYKVEAIINNVVYSQQTNSKQIPSLYYLV